MTNIASGSDHYVKALIDKGAIERFILIISEDNTNLVRE
jgi:hypothetical protein